MYAYIVMLSDLIVQRCVFSLKHTQSGHDSWLVHRAFKEIHNWSDNYSASI